MTTDIRYFTTVDACSCLDWWYRGRLRPCKHVKALRGAVDLIESHRTFNVMNWEKEEHVWRINLT